MLRIGSGNDNIRSNGIIITPPSGYDLLWVRIPNDNYVSFRLSQVNAIGADIWDLKEIYSGGFRKLNNISPDGSVSGINNTAQNYIYNVWISMPLRKLG